MGEGGGVLFFSSAQLLAILVTAPTLPKQLVFVMDAFYHTPESFVYSFD